jgi:hypothetical protein
LISQDIIIMTNAGETCSNSSNFSMFTGNNLFAALMFSFIIAILVVVFTELIRPKVQPLPPPQAPSSCKKCETVNITVPATRDLDPREYKLQKGSFTPSDVTVRSKVWHHHPAWHIPSLEREKIQVFNGIDDVLKILDRFDVSPHR